MICYVGTSICVFRSLSIKCVRCPASCARPVFGGDLACTAGSSRIVMRHSKRLVCCVCIQRLRGGRRFKLYIIIGKLVVSTFGEVFGVFRGAVRALLISNDVLRFAGRNRMRIIKGLILRRRSIDLLHSELDASFTGLRR